MLSFESPLELDIHTLNQFIKVSFEKLKSAPESELVKVIIKIPYDKIINFSNGHSMDLEIEQFSSSVPEIVIRITDIKKNLENVQFEYPILKYFKYSNLKLEIKGKSAFTINSGFLTGFPTVVLEAPQVLFELSGVECCQHYVRNLTVSEHFSQQYNWRTSNHIVVLPDMPQLETLNYHRYGHLVIGFTMLPLCIPNLRFFNIHLHFNKIRTDTLYEIPSVKKIQTLESLKVYYHYTDSKSSIVNLI